MSEKLNWGVMGNANIARVCVIPAIQQSTNGTIRALASRFPQKAADTATKHGIHRIYGSYRELIDDPEIEAVYIPLPNHLHHGWSIKALNAGKHVLCEKPLACNAREAGEMADVAASTGYLLMEAFMYRFHPRSHRIRHLVQEGAIGTPRLIRTAFCFRMSSEDFKNPHNARLKTDMGGGALLDVGCYGVSVARWLYGGEPVKAQCQACYHSEGVDVHVTGMLQFENQQLATLEASFISGLQQTYTVVGEKGVIDLPQDAFIPWEKDALFILREHDAASGVPRVIPGADEYRLMVEHFADAVRGRVSLAYSPADSIQNMRVLDALSEAARSGNTVMLPALKDGV